MKYSVCKYIYQKEGFTISVSFGGNHVLKTVAVAAPVAVAAAPVVVAAITPFIAPVAIVLLAKKLTEK